MRTGVVDLGGDISASLAAAAVADLAGDTYEFLIATPDQVEVWTEAFQNNYDDATLLGMFDQLAFTAGLNLDNGNADDARIYIDLMYSVGVELENRGLTPPEDTPSVNDILERYQGLA